MRPDRAVDVRDKLPELKAAGLPRCQFADVFKAGEGGEELPAEDREAMDAYLRIFLPPSRTLRCICCGAQQGGMMTAILGGGFRWGLANGEGFCSTCGYPARAHHRNFGPVKFVEFVLQYHPDELELQKRRTRRS